MRTIYMDHNIVNYYVAGFPPTADEQAEHKALSEIDERRDDIRIAFSVWNLVEASRSQPREKAQRFGKFVELREPIWLTERRILQREELKRFVWTRFFDSDDEMQVQAFAHYFSQAMHDLAPRAPALIGERPSKYLMHLYEHPGDLSQIQQTEMETPRILTTLQDARRAGEQAALDKQAQSAWINLSLPDRAPDGKAIVPEDRCSILTYCTERYRDVLAESPCLYAEELLAEYRTENPSRKPQPTDAIDLMHLAPALAYCDAIVTNDAYILGQARRVVRETGRDAVIARTLSEVAIAFRDH